MEKISHSAATRLQANSKGAALVEYIILMAFIGVLVLGLSPKLFDVDTGTLFSRPTTAVAGDVPERAGIPDPQPPQFPPMGPQWPSYVVDLGDGLGEFSANYYCAPPGSRWTGTAWEVPGAVFYYNRPPMHFPNYVPLSNIERTGTIRPDDSNSYFWYPKFQGTWTYFFIPYDYWGKEIEILPGSVRAPGDNCVSPPEI